MRKRLCIRGLLILLTGGLMAAIFLFSSQTAGASNELSRGLAEMLLSRAGIQLTAEQAELVNLALRKIAHFSLYCLLGAGAMGICMTFPMKDWQRLAAAVFFCALFAAGDECHQFLSGTRNGNLFDVLLDSCGAICGCAVMMGIGKVFHFRMAGGGDGENEGLSRN